MNDPGAPVDGSTAGADQDGARRDTEAVVQLELGDERFHGRLAVHPIAAVTAVELGSLGNEWACVFQGQ